MIENKSLELLGVIAKLKMLVRHYQRSEIDNDKFHEILIPLVDKAYELSLKI